MADGPRRPGDWPLPGVRTTLPMGSDIDPARTARVTPPPRERDTPRPPRDTPRPPRQTPRPPRDTLDGMPAATLDPVEPRVLTPGPAHVEPVTPTAPVRVDHSGTTLPVRKVDLGEETTRPPMLSADANRLAAVEAVLPSSATHRMLPAIQQQGMLTPPAPAPEHTTIWVASHKPPPSVDRRLILVREPDSLRAAAFRVLRYRLQQQGDPRTILVASAVAGEGRTTCAANLALALGECGRARVLLVEANLRTPAIAALFGFLPPACFSAQLTTHRQRPADPWSVVEVYSPSLHVLAVKPGEQSRPLLDAPAFATAMDALKKAGYDYIVIDTPPVLGSADVNLIEDCADGVLLTTWAGRSTARALRRAARQLAPTNLLGVTLINA
jgi:Mrp family chromosome partitioning ATPase